MDKKIIYFWIKILAVLGIVMALYLLREQMAVSPWQICKVNVLVNCDAVISGDVAKTFGLPTPLIGLVGYIMILFGAIIKHQKLVFGMATFGLVFCLYIAYRDYLLRTICPVCIGCQLDMIGVFILSLVLRKK